MNNENKDEIQEILDKKLLGIFLLNQIINCSIWFGRKAEGNGLGLMRSSITSISSLNMSGKWKINLATLSFMRRTSQHLNPPNLSNRKLLTWGRKKVVLKKFQKMLKISYLPISLMTLWYSGSSSRTRVKRWWTT